MLAKILWGMLGTATLVTGYVVHEGAVRIDVRERVPEEKRLSLLVPAALIPLGVSLAPDEALRRATAELHPWLPAIRVASKGLADLPDATLVEVRDADEHVTVSTRGATLVIDVRSPRETVHVSVPLKLVNRVARQLEALGPPA